MDKDDKMDHELVADLAKGFQSLLVDSAALALRYESIEKQMKDIVREVRLRSLHYPGPGVTPLPKDEKPSN